MKGTIFALEEFSVYDGPGVRTGVFFSGCPLRCNWCHNPEGFCMAPKPVRTMQGCLNCGRCEAVCPNPGDCRSCGACALACPRRLIRMSAETVEAAELAGRIMKNAKILSASGGGVTFTGGEALMQPDFLFELLELTKPLHRAVETCGHIDPGVFERAARSCDLVMIDIKMTDPDDHKKYTGVSNNLILSNLARLCNGNTPFTIRIPLIPGVNDNEDNMAATADLIAGCKNLTGVELLPYNRAAGAKYARMGMTYAPLFDVNAGINVRADIFTDRGIPCTVF